MSRFCSAILAIVFTAGSLLAQTPPKVKVLILTGASNHKWAATTPALREILEQSGRFEVRVNEEVRGNGSETFAPMTCCCSITTTTSKRQGPAPSTVVTKPSCWILF